MPSCIRLFCIWGTLAYCAYLVSILPFAMGFSLLCRYVLLFWPCLDRITHSRWFTRLYTTQSLIALDRLIYIARTALTNVYLAGAPCVYFNLETRVASTSLPASVPYLPQPAIDALTASRLAGDSFCYLEVPGQPSRALGNDTNIEVLEVSKAHLASLFDPPF